MQNFVKVGPKQKHLEIPEGYQVITKGQFLKGDLCADIYSVKWTEVDEDDWKEPAFDIEQIQYDFVIRKI